VNAHTQQGKRLYLLASESEVSFESVGIQEDSNSASDSSGRKVVLESSDDDTVVTVSSGDLTEDGSVFSVVLQGLGLVDVSNSLTEVERSVVGIIDTLDLQQSLVFVLDDLGSSKTEEDRLNPQSNGGTSLSGGLSDLLGLLSNLSLLSGGFGHLFYFFKIVNNFGIDSRLHSKKFNRPYLINFHKSKPVALAGKPQTHLWLNNPLNSSISPSFHLSTIKSPQTLSKKNLHTHGT